MRMSDSYHKWVESSDEDQVYIGKCPDVITGIHGVDPRQVYADLCDVVEDVMRDMQASGHGLPPSRIRPMCEVR